MIEPTLTPFKPRMSFQFFELYRRSGRIVIIDVREPDELVTDGKIPGAINVPKGQLVDALRMTPEQFKKVLVTSSLFLGLTTCRGRGSSVGRASHSSIDMSSIPGYGI